MGNASYMVRVYKNGKGSYLRGVHSKEEASRLARRARARGEKARIVKVAS